MPRKKPRFFCDNCGVEVGRDAKACPQCGRFFASVRCPSCGFTGEEKAFSAGCPSCGYSAPPYDGALPVSAAQISVKKKLVPAGKLPVWVYVLSICAFIGIVVVLVLKLIY